MSLEFGEFVGKYPRFEREDAANLESHFNAPEHAEAVKNFEDAVRQRKRVATIAGIGVFAAVAAFAIFKAWTENLLPVLLGASLAGGIAALIGFLVTGIGATSKSDTFGSLAKALSDRMEYSPAKDLFEGDIGEFRLLDMLAPYDRIKKQEDSIRYRSEGNPSFVVTGMEFVTEKMRRTKNGTHYYVNNWGYLFDARLSWAEFPVASPVRLLRDGKDFSNRIGKFLAPFIVVLIVLGHDKDGWIAKAAYGYLSENPVVLLVVTLAVAAWGFHAIGRRSKGHTKLESPEFEKTFDVFGDEVEVRKLLTPGFMERVTEFVKNDPEKRKIEFAFLRDGFRMKVDLARSGGTMELPKYGGTKAFKESVVKFYLELKSVIMLANDLNLAYYAKTRPAPLSMPKVSADDSDTPVGNPAGKAYPALYRTNDPTPTSLESAESTRLNGISS